MKVLLAALLLAACATDCPAPSVHRGPQQTELVAAWRARFPATWYGADECLSVPVDWKVREPGADFESVCPAIAAGCTHVNAICPFGAVRSDFAHLDVIWAHEFAHRSLWCDTNGHDSDSDHKRADVWSWVDGFNR